MIFSMIVNQYLSVFTAVGLMSLTLFSVGLYWILHREKMKAPIKSHDDLSPIAGDDILSTQLDLARAYLETNNKHLAQPILQLVIEQGNKTQIAEAKSLLCLI